MEQGVKSPATAGQGLSESALAARTLLHKRIDTLQSWQMASVGRYIGSLSKAAGDLTHRHSLPALGQTQSAYYSSNPSADAVVVLAQEMSQAVQPLLAELEALNHRLSVGIVGSAASFSSVCELVALGESYHKALADFISTYAGLEA